VIHETRPDLVLAGPIQRSAFLAALAGFKPLVSMSWGYDLLIDAHRNSFWEWATHFTLKRSAALVGDCETIRRLAVSYGMPDQSIVTFPWGIDLEHFRPAASRPETASGAPFTLLSTRGWEPVYGVDLIARAFVKASAMRPELRLVMLGNGSQAGQLRQILSNRGLIQTELSSPTAATHRLLFPGQVAFRDLTRYYHSADLYISASHSDGTSISLLEAMACGVPAIVSDIPGNREWIEEGINGWLFPDGDADALSHAILNALDQRQQLPEMGRRARQITEERADWHKNFPKLSCAFEIAQKSRRPAKNE
jgi:glycosyltransferase involved in cell wall biosynthesis